MAVEEVLNLLDSYWFGPNILGQKLKLPTSPFVAKEEEPKISDMASSSLEIRSISARCIRYEPSSPFTDYLTPNSLHTSPKKLQKIHSGKEISVFSKDEIVKNEQKRHVRRNSSSRRKGISRSLSDLESEEVKGFIDLGFVFTEEDKDSSLVSIIPGLQRWGTLKKKQEQEHEQEKIAKKKEEIFEDLNGSLSRISRPYLSEAWEDLEKRKAKGQLSKWKLPALIDESNIKNELKAWAHTVASAVK